MSSLPVDWRLPAGWEMKHLGEVATLQRGFDLPVQDRQEGSFKIFAANGPVGTHKEPKVRGPGVVTGRSGSIGKVHYVEEDYWPLNTSLWVKDFHGNDPQWVSRLLTWMHLEKFTRGVGVPTLNRNLVHEVEIPLPPLEEQKRIAEILDQADALRRLRTRALDKLNTLGQAIFHEMFGAEAKSIISTKAQKVEDFCDVSSGSTPSRKVAGNYEGTIPWVKTGEVNGCTILQTEENVSEAGRANARLKTYPTGTVLIAMYGQGKTRGQVGILGIAATTNQACAALVCKKTILPEFLFYQLRSSYERLRDQGRGGNQPNLNGSMVKDFPIFVPDMERQATFVTCVQRAELQAEGYAASSLKLETLFSSLQHRAFRGQL